MKKILVIYFSQSGQLENILSSFCLPLEAAGHKVDNVKVSPRQPYPFPWKGNTFFAVMPDCVQGVPAEMEPFEIPEENYDLVVLGYQAWFLSPSIPCNSFLMDNRVRRILKGTPVVTITGARNMWISAMERIRTSLKEIGAHYVGNIALVDRHANFVSFITIFYWMLTGRKDRFLNLFPAPGVSEVDMKGSEKYGQIVRAHLDQGKLDSLQQSLVENRAVHVKYNLMFIESKARKIFKIWAGIIAKRKNRAPWLSLFKYYLMIALFVAAPVILTVDLIFFKPFLGKRIKRQKLYYSGLAETL